MDEQEALRVNREIYWAGVKSGVERYAWWKNGVKWVGIGVITLKQALEEIDEDMKKAQQ